jgi:hypothetical protein
MVGLTSGRPCRRADLKEASNQLCLVSEDTHQDLEGASHEEVINDVVAEVMMSGTVANEAMKICRS